MNWPRNLHHFAMIKKEDERKNGNEFLQYFKVRETIFMLTTIYLLEWISNKLQFILFHNLRRHLFFCSALLYDSAFFVIFLFFLLCLFIENYFWEWKFSSSSQMLIALPLNRLRLHRNARRHHQIDLSLNHGQIIAGKKIRLTLCV